MSARDEAAGGVELLPCPFCGGTDLYWPHGTDPAVIECGGKNGCGARSGVQDEQTEARAAAAWNRRAPSPCDQACSAMLGSAAVAAPFENEQTPSPAAVAAAIIEWDRRGRLVDDESYVQNNAPTVARAYYDLREVSSAMLGALEEQMAADDALSAFLLIAEPKVLGEEKWRREHGERSERRRRATMASRRAIQFARSAGIEPGEGG